MIKTLLWLPLCASVVAACGGDPDTPMFAQRCDGTFAGSWKLELEAEGTACPKLGRGDYATVQGSAPADQLSSWYLGWWQSGVGTHSAQVESVTISDAYPASGCRVLISGESRSGNYAIPREDNDWILTIRLDFRVSDEPVEGTFEYAEEPGRFNDAASPCNSRGGLSPYND